MLPLPSQTQNLKALPAVRLGETIQMKLDRNTNPKGHGKYALVNMRKFYPIFEADQSNPLVRSGKEASDPIVTAFQLLVKEGIISLGNETPGDQFFVMKYKDKFTSSGLRGYAEAIIKELADLEGPQFSSLAEYAQQIISEANAAHEIGNRIPD